MDFDDNCGTCFDISLVNLYCGHSIFLRVSKFQIRMSFDNNFEIKFSQFSMKSLVVDFS